jgi:hypothetical protein
MLVAFRHPLFHRDRIDLLVGIKNRPHRPVIEVASRPSPAKAKRPICCPSSSTHSAKRRAVSASPRVGPSVSAGNPCPSGEGIKTATIISPNQPGIVLPVATYNRCFIWSPPQVSAANPTLHTDTCVGSPWTMAGGRGCKRIHNRVDSGYNTDQGGKILIKNCGAPEQVFPPWVSYTLESSPTNFALRTAYSTGYSRLRDQQIAYLHETARMQQSMESEYKWRSISYRDSFLPSNSLRRGLNACTPNCPLAPTSFDTDSGALRVLSCEQGVRATRTQKQSDIPLLNQAQPTSCLGSACRSQSDPAYPPKVSLPRLNDSVAKPSPEELTLAVFLATRPFRFPQGT